jgi:hypothetical protein
MRLIVAIAGIALCITGCMKDTEELAQDTGVLPSSCGTQGARLQAVVNGSSYCANGQIVATGNGESAMITGVSLLGTTLVVQVDSLGLGTQPITEATNGMLYMENGTSYVVMPPDAGVLNIMHLDTAARTLKASFSAMLRNEMSGNSRTVEGTMDILWTTSE